VSTFQTAFDQPLSVHRKRLFLLAGVHEERGEHGVRRPDTIHSGTMDSLTRAPFAPLQIEFSLARRKSRLLNHSPTQTAGSPAICSSSSSGFNLDQSKSGIGGESSGKGVTA
jgi:hypothetical protein